MEKISERGIVNIGSKCNLKCQHCYYLNQEKKWKNVWWIIFNILVIKICRMKKIDITGGEPSIYPKIDFLVTFCNLLGFKEIRIVTNGIRYFRLQKLMDDFPKVRFSVSIHSQNAMDIEKLTRYPLAQYEIEQFIKRCRARINYVNCVITPYNTDLENIFKLLKPFGEWPVTICFKHLDYNFNHDIINFPMYFYRNLLNKAIRMAPETQRIDMRFFPFCFMDDSNIKRDNVKCCSAITNTVDQNDWLPVISRKTPWYRWILFIFGTSQIREWEAVKQAIIQGKSECAHAPQCTGCVYENKCDGVQKGYLKKFGNRELVSFK